MRDFDVDNIRCSDVIAAPIILTALKIKQEAAREALILKDAARCVEQIYRDGGAGTVKGIAAGTTAALFIPLFVACKLLVSSKEDLIDSVSKREMNIASQWGIKHKQT